VRGPLKVSKNVENTFFTITFVLVEISNWNFGYILGSAIPIFWLKKFPPRTPPGGDITNYFFENRDFQVGLSRVTPKSQKSYYHR
jgi:hypothetical protein